MVDRRVNSLHVGVILAVLLTALPLAAATEPVAGEFTTRGMIRLPTTSEASVSPLAALLDDTTKLHGFVLTTSALRACEYEKRYPELEAAQLVVQSPPTHFAARCYPLTDVRIELAPDGEHAGWLGFYPKNGAQLKVGANSLETRTLSTLAGPGARSAASSSDPPDWPFYFQQVVGTHLLVNATGEMGYAGPGALKVNGPDVIVTAAENTTRQETYSRSSSDAAVREHDKRWLFLEFDHATIEFDTGAPLAVASRQAAATWDGRLSLGAVEGTAVARSGEYRAVGRDGWIEGSFSGTFLPLANERVRLLFGGEMRATSIPFEPGSAVPASGGFSLLGLVAVVVGSVAMGTSLLYVRTVLARKRPHPTFNLIEDDSDFAGAPMTYLMRAEEAADGGQWDVACDLMARAREDDPERRELSYVQGMYLLKAANLSAALACFDEASQVVGNGEPDRMAAICAARLGLMPEAKYFAIRALDRTSRPDLVDEILTDDDLGNLRWDETVQETAKNARARFKSVL